MARAYASKPFDTIKLRYRRCDDCGERLKSIEQYEPDCRVPPRPGSSASETTGKPARPCCPDCGKQLRARGEIQTPGGAVRTFECQPCNQRFKAEPDGTGLTPVLTRLIEVEIRHRVLP